MATPATGQPSLGAGQVSILQEAAFPPLPIRTNSADITSFPKSIGLSNDNSDTLQENYANALRNLRNYPTKKVKPIPMKTITYPNGIPRVMWMEREVKRMNVIENLQYTIVGKFSYGWPELEELRMLIPK
ncbi:hypothetical protein KY284_010339 [Solanum tuberosum]|nr:hypothetical protein KY284_010339 [Solanum tuberosum]